MTKASTTQLMHELILASQKTYFNFCSYFLLSQHAPYLVSIL